MRRHFLALLATACAADPGETTHEIRGGSVTLHDSAVVGLVGFNGNCTGTMIASRVVLTAAHCLDTVPQWVYIGSDLTDPGWVGTVIEREAHPDWDPVTLHNDIALLYLHADAPLQPRAISKKPVDDTFVDQPMRIVGYGIVTYSDTWSGGLRREVTVPLDSYDAWELLSGDQTKGVSYGDSGGPQFMTIDHVEVVVGVTSAVHESTGRGLAARVDQATAFIGPWVEAHSGRPLPSAAVGESCASDEDCTSYVCFADDGYCSIRCSSDADCPSEMSCTDVDPRWVCAYPGDPPPPPPAADACTANGAPGLCLPVSSCLGDKMSVPGFCPGSADIQCCVAKPATTTPPPPPIVTPDDPPAVEAGCAIGARHPASGGVLLGMLLAMTALFGLSRRRR